MLADPQKLAADPLVSAFVTANAGSGKTSTLVDRVARLLLTGAKPEAILCVTYTKAAAAEMQRRLFEKLGAWAVTSDADLREQLRKLGDPDRQPARARRLFAQALETPGGLKIQTIHAFCERLLRRFPVEAGLSPAFRVAEDAAQEQLSADARAALAREVLSSPGSPVDQAYGHFAVRLAYNHFDDLIRLLEGRRAKVAAVLAEPDAEARIWRRCGFADGEPVHPDRIRAGAVLPPALDLELWLALAACFDMGGKSDADAAARLRAAIAHAEHGAADFDAAWTALFTDKGEPRFAKRPPKCLANSNLGPALVAEQTRLQAARSIACAATVAQDTVRALVLGAAYGRAYERIKAERSLLDFADLVARTRELLTVRADAAWVLYKLDGGVDHVLVDEAQDTAPEQWDILKALTEEFFSGEGRPGRGDHHTVFGVGDLKQSIYSFQGAQPERLIAEGHRYQALVESAGGAFRSPGLVTSYRSTPQVLAFVDAVFAPESARGWPQPEASNVVGHVPIRTDPGCVDLWPLFEDPKPSDREAWDAPLDAEPGFSARKRLAARIATDIRDAVARGEAVGVKGGGFRPARYDDFLILVRRREGLFHEIIRALKKAKVPVGGADRLKLADHILTDDLLALARVSLQPADDLSLAALLRSPFFDVDEDSLYALARGRTGSLWGALRRRAEERPEWTEAHRRLAALQRQAGGATPYEFYARFLAELDADGRSMTTRVLTRLGREAQDALEAFLGEAIAAEGRGVYGLEAFATALQRTTLEVKREQDEGRGEVRVMTVHGAKGLEAPVVYLPDTPVKARPMGPALLEDGEDGWLYAPRMADDCDASAEARAERQRKTDEESQRLLYVGLTRARDRLVICGRVSWTRKGEPEAGSWYDLCRAAFARPEIAENSRGLPTADGLMLRYGPDPVVVLSGRADEAAEDRPPAWVRRPAPAEPGAATYASPSDLAARSRAAAPSPLAPDRAGIGRFRRGDLIHHLLELLPDVPAAERPAAAERLLAKHADLTAEQRAEMAAAALGVLCDPRFAEVFGPGSRAEAAVAGGAPGLPPGLAVSGRVDRLVVTPERVLVVDFKTNRPSPDRVEVADPAYLRQMAIYMAVLRAVFPDRRVEAALVWTDGPKLMPIPEELAADTLAALPGAVAPASAAA